MSPLPNTNTFTDQLWTLSSALDEPGLQYVFQREREREEVKAKGLAEGRKKKETGCQYMPWAEKMSKTHMVEAWRDTGCSLHCIVP